MSKHQLHERIERDGSYHGQTDMPEFAPTAFETLRELYKLAAHATVDLCPEGRELSLALTAIMDNGLPMAIGAIARDDGHQLDANVVEVWAGVVADIAIIVESASDEFARLSHNDAKAAAEAARDSHTHTTYDTIN